MLPRSKWITKACLEVVARYLSRTDVTIKCPLRQASCVKWIGQTVVKKVLTMILRPRT